MAAPVSVAAAQPVSRSTTCTRRASPSTPHSASLFAEPVPGRGNANPALGKGSFAPRARQAASPIFRAALVQTSPALRPFHSAALHCDGGETPRLAVATPTFARRRSACMYTPLPIQRQMLSATGNEENTHEEQRRIPDHRHQPHPRVHHQPAASSMRASWPSWQILCPAQNGHFVPRTVLLRRRPEVA